ncbi:MAG: tetratricopeptide repeat protein [Candidatus Marinimicrobia bacterium]|nr:tetratricopeptide repeat protein [Candidatus Neomarinimicrobiota bacterium]
MQQLFHREISKLAVFILVFVFGVACFAQIRPNQAQQSELKYRFEMAQRLELQGQMDQALEIYRFLVDSQPENYTFYSRYSKLLFQNENFPEAERVIRRFLSLNPNFESVAIDLGRLFFVKGDTVQAFTYWKDCLDRFHHSLSIYQTMFNVLVSVRQYERAEHIIYDARIYLKKPDQFSLELANYFLMRGEYVQATQEFLLNGRANPKNYSLIDNQLMKIPNEPALADMIDSLIAAEINNFPEVPELRRIRADFNFKFKRFEVSWREMLLVESLTGFKGNTILDFVNDLVNEREYRQAEKCYAEIIQKREFQPITPKALLGLADAVEKSVLTQQTASPLGYFFPGNVFFKTEFVQNVADDESHLQSAFSIYDSLIVAMPKSAYSAQALYRLAELRFLVLRDFDGANSLYEQAIAISRDARIIEQCRLRTGDIFLVKGDLTSALEIFRRETEHREGSEIEKSAQVRELLTLFLSGDIESVLKMKNDVLGLLGAKHELFNDVLELMSFIDENYTKGDEKDKAQFSQFTKGELFIRQNKLSEAENVYQFLLSDCAGSLIEPAVRFRLLQMKLMLQPVTDCTEIIAPFVDNPNDYSDETAFMLAEISELQDHRPSDAVYWYELILEKFPESLYCDQARNKLREIEREQIP